MRKIKFRAWDKKEREFINIKSFGFLENGEVWYLQAIDESEKEIDPPYFIDEDDWMLMQYTGLKDKNGKEIYEGDVVRYKQRNLADAFGMTEGEDYLDKTKTIKFIDQSFNVPAGFIKDLEVIGNIYEK